MGAATRYDARATSSFMEGTADGVRQRISSAPGRDARGQARVGRGAVRSADAALGEQRALRRVQLRVLWLNGRMRGCVL